MEIFWIGVPEGEDSPGLSTDGARAVSVDEVEHLRARDDGVLWFDLTHTEAEGLAVLARLIGDVNPDDLAECHNRSPVPKLRPYRHYHFSAINGLTRASANGRLYFQPLKTFLTERMLFTVLGPVSSALQGDEARRDLLALRRLIDAGALRPRSAFELIGAQRKEMLRAHEALVATAAGRIADLEQRVMSLDPVRAERLLSDLFGLRHDLQMLRTNAAQTQELYTYVIEQLSTRDDLMRLDLRRASEMRQGFAHLQNTIDLERDYLQEVIDLFQTRVSTELNRFVRKITAFGTIAIAWTVIAGIYGMNFEFMPELQWRYGYPGVLLTMALVGIVFAVLFRRRGWL